MDAADRLFDARPGYVSALLTHQDHYDLVGLVLLSSGSDRLHTDRNNIHIRLLRISK
jgi:hypothetical protein